MSKVAKVDSSSSPYVEYLDKEMTIMGLLSAFSVATPGLVVQSMAGAAASSPLTIVWNAGPRYWIVGSAAMLLAALLFYRQRSRLAWYYGQLCLARTPNAPEVDEAILLRDADSWETWVLYRWAFCALGVAVYIYGAALFLGVQKPVPICSDFWTLWLPATVGAVAAVAQWWVLNQYALSDEPWRDALHLESKNSTKHPREGT
jgi:hypothetical protein